MRLEAQNKVSFNVKRLKEVFLEARLEFVNKNQALTSTHALPLRLIREILDRFDQLFQNKLTRKVSILKYFLKIFLSLIHDKDVFVEFINLIEEHQEEV